MLKWCIIGGGGIADRRAIPAILKDKGSILCAIMERVPKRCEELAKKYGVPCFTDTREMLSAVECDAVYIGTPLGCHAEDMLCCLEFSKRVFIEKPFTMKADEGRRIADMFIERDLQLTVGYMMKYHNLHKKAKEIISRGGRRGYLQEADRRFQRDYRKRRTRERISRKSNKSARAY